MTSGWTSTGQWKRAASHRLDAETEGDAEQPAHHRQGERLGEKLHEHVERLRPERHADADLARSLRHADEHDVHDADAPDEERHRRDAREEHGHRLRSLFLGARDLAQVADGEVVVLALPEVVALAKERRDVGLGARGLPFEGLNVDRP